MEVNMTDKEQKRWIEIQFYLSIQNILNAFNRNVVVYDIIELFCDLFEINKTKVKPLVQDIILGSSSIKPGVVEACVLSAKQKLTVRQVLRMFHIGQQTYYDSINAPYALTYTYNLITDDETVEELNKFLKCLDKFKKL
jgi:hypothetical protein